MTDDSIAMTDDSYVTLPTRWTVFLRTFLPWQMWRFARINLKMIGVIRHRMVVDDANHKS